VILHIKPEKKLAWHVQSNSYNAQMGWGGVGGNVNMKQALLTHTIGGGGEPVIFRLLHSSYKKYTF